MKEDKRAKEATEPNRKEAEADPESGRRRQKWYATLQAQYDRRLGVPLRVAERQEKLIQDARTYAASYLLEAHSQVAQLRVTRLALTELGITPNTEKFPLSFEALHKAIWTEGDPSLEELANKAGEDESADTQTRPVLSGLEGGETAPAKLSRKGPEFPVEHWGEVEISFFNEFSVQITAGKIKTIREFGQLGMAHKRSGKPTLAWQTLHDLAHTNPPGTIARATGRAKEWSTQEKRMQELRTWFRDQFGLSEDPLPFVKGIGYQAKFKISLARSYQR